MFPPADDVSRLAHQEFRKPQQAVVLRYGRLGDGKLGDGDYWRVLTATDSGTFLARGAWTGDMPLVLNRAYSTELAHELERITKSEVWVPPTVW